MREGEIVDDEEEREGEMVDGEEERWSERKLITRKKGYKLWI